MNRKEKVAEFEQGYNVSVTGRHVHVTEGMKQHAIDKISKLERWGNRIIDISVTMDIQKLEQKVDIVLKYGHTLIKSSASSSDMYVSIDQCLDKLQAQLRKYKKRLQDHHAKNHKVEDMKVEIYRLPADDVVQEVNEAIEAENARQVESSLGFPKIISTEVRPLKILTAEEAIMKLELSKDQFMIFRSEIDRKLKVIYRRGDGHFGIIEVE